MSTNVKGSTLGPHLPPPTDLADSPQREAPEVLAQHLVDEAYNRRAPALVGQAEQFRDCLREAVKGFLAQNPSASEKELKAFVQAQDAKHFKDLALGGFSSDYIKERLQQRLGGKG